MDTKVLEDFIKYAKEQFDCVVYTTVADKAETFSDFFGASFLGNENIANECLEVIEYDNKTANVCIHMNCDIKFENLSFAA